MEYGCPLWAVAPASHLASLDALKNRPSHHWYFKAGDKFPRTATLSSATRWWALYFILMYHTLYYRVLVLPKQFLGLGSCLAVCHPSPNLDFYNPASGLPSLAIAYLCPPNTTLGHTFSPRNPHMI